MNHLAKKSSSKSNKGIAFKSTQVEPSETSDNDDDISEEEIVFFAKKFRKFVKARKFKSFW